MHEPLTPSVFHVLLALGAEPLHGYAIMRRVEEESGIAMGPGTIYGTLNRLVDAGWVAESEAEDGDARRRRRFALTHKGREHLGSELARMERLTDLARRRGLSVGEAG
jgi:DNA-binding PadR family transcriptional regulator